MDKKRYEVWIDDYSVEKLRELKGFLSGLSAAGKTVPGSHVFKTLQEGLKQVDK